MCIIEEVSENVYNLHIWVKSRSKTQEILKIGEGEKQITILLRSRAFQNKANKELLTLLKKKLKVSTNQIKIISGVKDRNKILQISFDTNINKDDLTGLLFT